MKTVLCKRSKIQMLFLSLGTYLIPSSYRKGTRLQSEIFEELLLLISIIVHWHMHMHMTLSALRV